MLDRLIAYLRATLGGSRVSTHSLRAEFARLADYLELMQVRMGERLAVRLDLPEALAEHEVPALLLQPLVENAIKHGLEPEVRGGLIQISAHRDGAWLLLGVRDTGSGPGAASSGGTGFGLEQVRQRLAALYGADAALTLGFAPDAQGGTLASIRIPYTQTAKATA
jgi:LytS/YehU family sensor histidine kinase